MREKGVEEIGRKQGKDGKKEVRKKERKEERADLRLYVSMYNIISMAQPQSTSRGKDYGGHKQGGAREGERGNLQQSGRACYFASEMMLDGEGRGRGR